MMTGWVQSDEARVRLMVEGPRSRQQEIEVVIDTGYTASLSLPPAQIRLLRLRWQSIGRGILADGSECLFDVYEATVVWDGKPRRVLVDEADTDPLVGMALLRGYELNLQVRTGGKVTIRRIRQRPGNGRPHSVRRRK